MALCASVMAGIYASPVLAGTIDVNTENGGLNVTINSNGDFPNDGIYLDRTNPDDLKITGMFSVSADQLAMAIKGTDIDVSSVTAKELNVAGASGGLYVRDVDDGKTMIYTKAADADGTNTVWIDPENGNISTVGTIGVGFANGLNNQPTTILDKTGDINVGISYNADGSVAGQKINLDAETGNITLADKATVDGVDVSELADNTAGIVRLGETTTIENTVSVDKWGLKVLDENGKTVADINSTTGGINAAKGKFHVWSDGAIEGTALSLKNNGAQNVYIGNSGTARFGAEDGNNVRIENGVLYVYRNNEQLAVLGENGLTLTSSNNIRATLDAEQIANLNSTIKEGGVVDAKELNVAGASGGLYVRDVDDGKTMIYTKAADADGTNTVWIDPENGNISTVGTIGVGFANGLNNQPTTILDKTGDINVGISYNADGSVAGQKINLDAETGNITLADKATVDGVDVSELASNFNTTNANVGGITRTEGATDPGTGTTTIEDTLSVSKDSVSANVGNSFFNVEEDGIYMSNNGNGLAVGEDGISAYSGNASFNISNNNYNVTVGNSTMVVNGNGATFTNGEENGETVINGGTITASGDFVTVDKKGNTKYTLNTIGADLDTLEGNVGNIGENVGGIDRVDADNDGKKETTIVEDTLSVSKDQIGAVIGDSAFVLNDNYAGIYADNKTSIIVASDGINLNGTVNFIGHDGNSYTLSNLEGRVSDLEEKTQNIKLPNEPGQGGSSEVPPTGDGHTGFEGDVIVGGDINADAGNFNKVNTDEITVGDNTFIDGDSVNSNEGNFKDKVTVGGEGGTSITGDGMTVGTADKGTTVSDSGVSIKNEYGSVETGVVDGKNDVVVTDEDGNRTSLVDTAGRVDNLEQGVSELNNRVGELEDRIDKVGAMAAAIANLRTMGYDPAAPTEVAVGIGQYRDETGAALGLFHYPNRDFMLSLSVSTSGDEVMGGIGATWKFGRKSPEKVAEIKKAQAEADARRAEEAKLAKAEEMKQAAKEAKIKAQQERHAKLAAERAAQAEAAK